MANGRPPSHSDAELEKFADELILWTKKPLNIWFKDFCLDRNINPDCMSEWAVRNDKFRGAYELAIQHQESKLINGGLIKGFNSGIVKLVLTNRHGWSDKSETKISGNAADPLQAIFTFIDGKTKDLIDGESAE